MQNLCRPFLQSPRGKAKHPSPEMVEIEPESHLKTVFKIGFYAGFLFCFHLLLLEFLCTDRATSLLHDMRTTPESWKMGPCSI